MRRNALSVAEVDLDPRRIGAAVRVRAALLCTIAAACAYAIPIALLPGCSGNVARPRAPEDLEEEARIAMEEGRYAEAQAKLERYLAGASTDYAARSLLAAAHAAQGGVILLDILMRAATKVASESSETSSRGAAEDASSDASPTPAAPPAPGASPAASPASASGSDEASGVLVLLPRATASNVARLKAANAQMALIPKTSLTAAMRTQGSVFLLFETFLFLARLKENPSHLAALSAADAARMVSNLSTAATLAVEGRGNPFASTITGASAELAQSPGTSDKEKVEAFVSTLGKR